MTLNYMKVNRNDREVYCPKCHIYSIRADDDPKCNTCSATLIKVVRSILTGERITGAVRLNDYNP